MSVSETLPTTNGEAVAVTADMGLSDKKTEGVPRVYIGNLPYRTSREEISGLFPDLQVTGVTIPRARRTTKDGETQTRRLGFAFVHFASPEDAQKAVDIAGDHTTLKDRPLTVRLAHADSSRPPRTRRSKKAAPNGSQEQGAEGKENKIVKPAEKKAVEGAEAKKPRQRKILGAPTTDTVYITGLPVKTTVEEVKELIGSAFEPLETRCHINRSRFPQRRPPHTTAYVKFADEATQQRVIAEVDGKTFKNVTVRAAVANEPSKLVPVTDENDNSTQEASVPPGPPESTSAA